MWMVLCAMVSAPPPSPLQAHASEMILPARYADVIRGMASNGDGGGADTMAQSTIHIHGAPDDSIKLRDLAVVLKRMHRNFEFVR